MSDAGIFIIFFSPLYKIIRISRVICNKWILFYIRNFFIKLWVNGKQTLDIFHMIST